MEETFPYQGEEGVTELQFYRNHPEIISEIARTNIEPVLGMTLEEAVALVQEEPEKAEDLFAIMYNHGRVWRRKIKVRKYLRRRTCL